MSDRDSLLATIIEYPNDDTPRLIYADLIQEEGDEPRAEFIRVQIELARIGPCQKTGEVNLCEHCTLRMKERVLLYRHIGAWTKDLPKELITKTCDSCMWNRAYNFETGMLNRAYNFETGMWNRAYNLETGVVECRRCDGTEVVECYSHVEFTRGFVSGLKDMSWVVFEAVAERVLRQEPIDKVSFSILPHNLYIDMPEIVEALLRKRWPSIKTWKFPEPEHQFQFDLQGLPLPILHSDFEFSARMVAMARTADPIVIPHHGIYHDPV